MKDFYQPMYPCSLILCLLGLCFLPSNEVLAKKAEDVLMKLTFQVDMKYQEVHPQGVFITCNILNGDTQTKMEKVSSTVWALTIDAPIGYEVLWKFLNGPDNFEPLTEMEICAIGSTSADSVRTHITASHDEVLPPVCFGSCETCAPASAPSVWISQAVSISPNPAVDRVMVKYAFDKTETLSLRLHDAGGRLVRSWGLGAVITGERELRLDGLGAGAYWLEVDFGNQLISKKLIVGKP